MTAMPSNPWEDFAKRSRELYEQQATRDVDQMIEVWDVLPDEFMGRCSPC